MLTDTAEMKYSTTLSVTLGAIKASQNCQIKPVSFCCLLQIMSLWHNKSKQGLCLIPVEVVLFSQTCGGKSNAKRVTTLLHLEAWVNSHWGKDWLYNINWLHYNITITLFMVSCLKQSHLIVLSAVCRGGFSTRQTCTFLYLILEQQLSPDRTRWSHLTNI